VPIAEAMSRFTRCVKVEIDRVEGAIETLRQLKSVLGKHQGNCQTFLSVPAPGEKRALIVLDKQWSIRATPELKQELEFVLNGQGRVELAGDGTRRPQAVQQPLFQGAQITEAAEEIPVTISPVDEADFL